MPELPEVEVVRRGLDAHVVGRRITEAEFRGSRVVRRHAPGAADLSARIRDNLVSAARRRGKYLWLVLEAPDGHHQALLMHLGMSGQLLVEEPGAPDERHLHARFTFADDGLELRFVDQRTFGGITLAEVRHDGIPDPVAHIAPDPLENAWDEAAVVARMKSRATAVKRATSTPTRRSGGPACTGSGWRRTSRSRRWRGCCGTPGRSCSRRSARVARALTRCTST